MLEETLGGVMAGGTCVRNILLIQNFRDRLARINIVQAEK